MKVLFDLLPVLLFFLAYMGAKRAPETTLAIVSAALGPSATWITADPNQPAFLLATAVTIVAAFCQVGWLLLRKKTVDKMLWISLVIIVVMGGLTLFLHDPVFFKWKPTVLYWTFAVVLLGADLMFNRNLIRAAMQEQMTLADPVWRWLNVSWVGFFALMGVINLYVANHYSMDTWVNFKLFGGFGLMIVFVVAQALLLSRFVEHDEKK
ncbi:MAG: septation protein A [Betaproteobacteria bacterium]